MNEDLQVPGGKLNQEKAVVLEALTDLYLNVKIRKRAQVEIFDKIYYETEKAAFMRHNYSCLTIIEYIS